MLFADASSDVKTPSDNILIYGHNMKSGNMFHDLLLYEEEDFFYLIKRLCLIPFMEMEFMRS